MLFVIAVVAVIAAMNEFKRSGATEKKIGVNQQRVGRGRLFVPHLLLCYRLWALSSALSCGICSSVCVGGAHSNIEHLLRASGLPAFDASPPAVRREILLGLSLALISLSFLPASVPLFCAEFTFLRNPFFIVYHGMNLF